MTQKYAKIDTFSDFWAIAAETFGETLALKDPHGKPTAEFTYQDLYQTLKQFAAGLQALGVKSGDRVSLFADNCHQWLIADLGCMEAGAVDAVRSSKADVQELAYILEHSESTGLIAEDLKTAKSLAPFLPNLPIQWIVLLSDETPAPEAFEISVYSFSAILNMGQTHVFQVPRRDRNQLATLLYTSGTTGKPKGVMLTHSNLIHQITAITDIFSPKPGDIVLSILPTWHSFGRMADYFFLAHGATQVYTNIRNLKADLKTYRPEYMSSVPRLWESLYEGIQKQFLTQSDSQQKLIQFFFDMSEKYIVARRISQGLSLEHLDATPRQKIGAFLLKILLAPLHALGDQIVYKKVRDALGGNFILSISGGGALAPHLETFFETVGIELLVGYGLTETSPVLSGRRPGRNFRGSAGIAIPQTEFKIVNPETHEPLKLGQKGLVLVRGPQVMQGYYRNSEATQKAINPEGWFDTGDLGWLSPNQDLFLTGRAKDTIVLSNGENIEPEPLENACARSIYIDQILVVGQDQRSLGALLVPNFEALQKWAIAQNATLDLAPELMNGLPKGTSAAQLLTLESKPIQELYRQELVREVQNRPGYRPDDRIGPFKFVMEPFSIENGLLTQTLKVRRSVVADHYRDMIVGMF